MKANSRTVVARIQPIIQRSIRHCSEQLSLRLRRDLHIRRRRSCGGFGAGEEKSDASATTRDAEGLEERPDWTGLVDGGLGAVFAGDVEVARVQVVRVQVFWIDAGGDGHVPDRMLVGDADLVAGTEPAELERLGLQ